MQFEVRGVYVEVEGCSLRLRPEGGGSRGKKCPILIFQYVI